jgi:hypothetical protein
MLVEGEYYQSTNDLCIHGEIAPGAADKIRVAFFFVVSFLRHLDKALDGPGVSFNKAALSA